MPSLRAAARITLVVLILAAGCAKEKQAATPVTFVASPAKPTPTAWGHSTASDGSSNTAKADQGTLTVTFPAETTALVGGQSLRVTAYLVNQSSQPVQEAQVQAELYAPGGELFAELPCAHTGQGRFLSELVRLPLRHAAGTWRLTAQAIWGDGHVAHFERTFPALPSYSERLEGLYGFWIETSDLFAYNVAHTDDASTKYWPYQDGNGGTVILANSFFSGQPYQLFVMLDVHWRDSVLPADGTGAIAYVQSLAGPHRRDLIIPPGEFVAEEVTFQGQQAWRVLARWESTPENSNPRPRGFIEWDVFRCPGSDWLWTVVIATNETGYQSELREIRETFQCSPSERGASARTQVSRQGAAGLLY